MRAPELRGRQWLNTGGAPLPIAGLRGKIVLLDFWTSGCVNCLHVLDELRALEQRHADVLVTIGVHSPKFPHEADPQAVADAVERLGVHHPVLDDADLTTWDAYAARAWPTLAVVDPQGYVVAQVTGEGHGDELSALVDELVAEHADGLRRGPGPFVAPPEAATALRFPSRAVRLPHGTYLVSDTAHHQLVELADDLVTERRRIGTGERGLVDGAAPRFAEPQGMVLLPTDVAARAGYDLVVADSGNHALRGVRLAVGTASTVAGTGEQQRTRVPVGGTAPRLSTPWDLAWWDGAVVVAMAGIHQLWAFEPVTGSLRVLAGTADEGLRDGAPDEAFFAQPSGLAAAPPPGAARSPSGPAIAEAGSPGPLWIADAETSALRSLVASPAVGAAVTTAVGQGLFDFGLRDGAASEALLQHPSGVAVLPDGSVAVADTYNGAVRRYDPVARIVTTLARDLVEPGGLLVDGATLVIVESGAHRLVRVPVPASAQVPPGPPPERIDVGPGPFALRVAFTPPPGQHLDTRFGDPTSLTVTASPPELLAAGAGSASGLARELRFAGDGPAEGELRVRAAAAACDEGDGVFAACHRHQQDWSVPVRRGHGGAAELVLDLRVP